MPLALSQRVFPDIDPRLVAHNMLLTAHGWAVKRWNLSRWLTLDEYVLQELALLLASVRVDPQAAAGCCPICAKSYPRTQ